MVEQGSSRASCLLHVQSSLSTGTHLFGDDDRSCGSGGERDLLGKGGGVACCEDQRVKARSSVVDGGPGQDVPLPGALGVLKGDTAIVVGVVGRALDNELRMCTVGLTYTVSVWLMNA